MFVPLSQIGFNPNRPIPTKDELERIPTMPDWIRATVSPPPDAASIYNAVTLADKMAALKIWMDLDYDVMEQRSLTPAQYWIWILAGKNKEELARDLLKAGACFAQLPESADRTAGIQCFYKIFKAKFGEGPAAEMFAEQETSAQSSASKPPQRRSRRE